MVFSKIPKQFSKLIVSLSTNFRKQACRRLSHTESQILLVLSNVVRLERWDYLWQGPDHPCSTSAVIGMRCFWAGEMSPACVRAEILCVRVFVRRPEPLLPPANNILHCWSSALQLSDPFLSPVSSVRRCRRVFTCLSETSTHWP